MKQGENKVESEPRLLGLGNEQIRHRTDINIYRTIKLKRGSFYSFRGSQTPILTRLDIKG